MNVGPLLTIDDLITLRLAERGHALLGRIQRQRSAYSTSAPLDEVTVQLRDGCQLELMAKRLGRDALLEAARRVKPEFVCTASREPIVYAHLSGEVGPPQCWGVVEEPEGPLLVLERVPGLALRHVGELAFWEEAAEWLAGFHDRWSDVGGLGRELSPTLERHLLRYDHSHHALLLERAGRFAAVTGESLPAVVIEQHAYALQVLGELPTSLVHGEFYASNVIIDPATSPPRVAALDWEMAGIGCPLLDLAALVSGEWEPSSRRIIIEAYRRASPLGLSIQECEWAVTAAELLISVQWLGWATGWLPPEDLRVDWTTNATMKATALRARASQRTVPFVTSARGTLR